MKLVPSHKIHTSALMEPGTESDQCTQSALITHKPVAVVAAKVELGPDLVITPDEFAGLVATPGVGSAFAFVGIAVN